MAEKPLIERIQKLSEAGSFSNSVDRLDVLEALEKEKEWLNKEIERLEQFVSQINPQDKIRCIICGKHGNEITHDDYRKLELLKEVRRRLFG